MYLVLQLPKISPIPKISPYLGVRALQILRASQDALIVILLISAVLIAQAPAKVIFQKVALVLMNSLARIPEFLVLFTMSGVGRTALVPSFAKNPIPIRMTRHACRLHQAIMHQGATIHT
jgi:hypothetical protein